MFGFRREILSTTKETAREWINLNATSRFVSLSVRNDASSVDPPLLLLSVSPAQIPCSCTSPRVEISLPGEHENTIFSFA